MPRLGLLRDLRQVWQLGVVIRKLIIDDGLQEQVELLPAELFRCGTEACAWIDRMKPFSP